MIQRDGTSTSLWQSAAQPFREKTKPLAPGVFDVAVVGGGMTGIATALQLQLAGKSTIVLEAHNLGYGTTGGTTAHLNTLLDTPYSRIIQDFGEDGARLVATAAKQAVQLVEANVRNYNIACDFTRTNALLYSKDDKQSEELKSIKEASERAGVDTVSVRHMPLDLAHHKVLSVPGQARFNPMSYLHGLASALEDAGGIIMQQARVGVVHEGDPVQIESSAGVFKARALIYATHIPPGVNILHMRCSPWRSYALALRLDGEYPAELIYDMDDPYHYYRSHVVNDVEFLIAGGNDHKTGHDHDTAQSFQDLQAYVRRHLNVKEVAYTWSSQYYESVDGLPYIGHLPGHPDNMFVATGFGGNGMTYSHVAAQVLTSLITGQSTSFEDIFKPGRIKPIAGFKDFVVNNADVAKTLVRKLVPAQELDSYSGLAAGEGVIARIGEHDVAVHRDENGQIHAIDPTCSHMGCQVVWNMAEQSWDCPCHGARYDAEGHVLNGPATKDLERIRIEATQMTH